jgi:AcrR family transcriptional regulator
MLKIMTNEKTEQVLAAAWKVFVKYGYRRVTMADLAEAAQMSRPALYLVFSSKEQIFIEVVARLTNLNLKEIREGIQSLKTVDEKLNFAFEVWYIRPYELIQSSPDAADLYDSVKEFAADAIHRSAAEFESLLAEILEPLVRKKKSPPLSSRRIARILRTSAKGFHFAAADTADLRQMIGDMRKIVLTGL